MHNKRLHRRRVALADKTAGSNMFLVLFILHVLGITHDMDAWKDWTHIVYGCISYDTKL